MWHLYSFARVHFKLLVLIVAALTIARRILGAHIQAKEQKGLGSDAPALPAFAEKILVHTDNGNLPLKAAVEQAVADPVLSEYRQLRTVQGDTLEGQQDLARWCKRRDLDAQAQLHWAIVLQWQPNHAEAQKKLGLRSYRGILLTTEEIELAEQEEKLRWQALKTWTPKLKKLRTAIKRGDPAERQAALTELSTINDPSVLPAIEEVFADADQETLQCLVEVFAGMPNGEGIEFLIRQAIDSELPNLRADAMRALSYSSREEYIPQLLAELQAPIELSTRVSKKAGGLQTSRLRGYEYTGGMKPVFYHRYRLSGKYKASDVAAWGLSARAVSTTAITGVLPDEYRLDYELVRESPDPSAPYEYRGKITSTDGSAIASRQQLQQTIDALNASAAQHNQRVHEALVTATGQNPLERQLGANPDRKVIINPRPWWEWWKKQRQQNNYIAKGMEVWTQQGPLPVESLLLGDQVLTKNPTTGEFTFELLVGIDMQPQSEMQLLAVDGRTIVTTPQQLIFTTHVGKREAQELKKGSELETLAGPRRVEEVGEALAVWTYSLTVENAASYFVDRVGIQVAGEAE